MMSKSRRCAWRSYAAARKITASANTSSTTRTEEISRRVSEWRFILDSGWRNRVRDQSIAASPQCLYGLMFGADHQLLSQIGYMRLDHVGVMLPVVIIEVL